MVSATVERSNLSCEIDSEVRKRSLNAPDPNGLDKPVTDTSSISILVPKKYRHVAAVHVTQRTSCLSHDSDEAPSFLGFRNLMVLVLSKPSHHKEAVLYIEKL